MAVTLRKLFDSIDEFRDGLRRQLGKEDAEARLALVRELIVRLPHRFFATATKAEIQAAGRHLIASGRSSHDMRDLQETLVGLLDHAFRTGAVTRHPLRHADGAEDREVPRGALVVGAEQALVDTLEQLLGPMEIETLAARSAMAALDRVRWFPFAYVLSRFNPTSDQTAEFLAALRTRESLCGDSAVILLAEDRHFDQAVRYTGQGATRVLTLGNVDRELPPALDELGAVRDREKVRLTVRALLEGGRRTEVWQSENLSATGMLVRTRSAPADGTEVELSFQLPNDLKPVVVRAEIARHTEVGPDRAEGLGLRFVSFADDGQSRLEAYLEQQLGPQPS